MRKESGLIALLVLCAAVSANANGKRDEEPVNWQQEQANAEEIQRALATLLQTGTLKTDERGEIVVEQSLLDQMFIDDLRKSGLINPGKSRAARICIDPGL